VGKASLDKSIALDVDYTVSAGERCPVGVPPCNNRSGLEVDQWNGYVYWNVGLAQNVATTVGLAREYYNDHTSVRVDRWQPKLGVRWAASPTVTWRAATGSTIKRSYMAQQTIEPPQIVGFNQFFDAVDGSLVRTAAVAVDVRASPSTTFGAELGQQKLRIGSGFEGSALNTVPEEVQRIDWIRLDATSRASSALVAAIGLEMQRLRGDASQQSSNSPTKLRTTQLPLALRSYSQNGYFGEIVTTAVWQQVERRAPSGGPQGKERFVVVDMAIGWRLPDRRGTVSLDVKNLFGSKFSYQDDNFISTELRQASFQPVRRWWVKASLAF
jgi:hypothetical protein